MPPKRKKENALDDPAALNLPFSLYLKFARVAEVNLKVCGIDGRFLPGAPAFPTSGPCGVLCGENTCAPSCAESHAEAVAMAMELRRPYISNCHMRLVSWVIPILHDGMPLPVAIICGGTLLRAPDSALIAHARRVAAEQGVDPDDLAGALDSTPVLTRGRMRTIADFLFEMSAALASLMLSADLPETALPPASTAAKPSLVFPPSRKKEAQKAKIKRVLTMERQSEEAEIVRLMHERKPAEALEELKELLMGGGTSTARGAANLDAAETFTRLFRVLAEDKTVPQKVADKQSLLVAETLSRKVSKKSLPALDRACEKFIAVAEEIAGEPRPRQVRTIQSYLEKNIAKKLTLGGVGKKFGLGEKALDALLRKYFAMGLSDYVASLRVSEAKRLLVTTDLNMGQIARKTGFKDQSYFTKVFKSRIGSTPTEFREKKKS
jgi:AraC-like DNA-binding protein/ligand-binding sensor protein